MGKKDAVDDILVALIDVNRFSQLCPACSTFLNPSKEKNETIHGTLNWLL
jgi:hypothetical protein